MASELCYTAQTLLDYSRTCSAEDILQLTSSITELESQLPLEYLAGIPYSHRIICLRASLVCWSATEGKMVPRPMQLRSILADQLGHDSLVSAGTGSGKTLPIAINILLDDPSKRNITLTISPLKRLQCTQEQEFSGRYGIRTFVINEHTPRDDAWWTTNIYPGNSSIKEPAQHLIITVEQLVKSREGHLSRIGELMRLPAFQKLITRINIDEAHSFYTTGLPLYGLPAFRPAWGMLAELKIFLRQSLHWHLFSATFPPHILSEVKAKLLKPTFDYIHLTSNRQNIMYATHQVTNKLDDLRNYECFVRAPFDLADQPHILIFVDNKSLTAKIADHLDACLPSEYRRKGVVRHYHSDMSAIYLDQTHQDFVSPAGRCRILVATSGESVGVDFPNVKIVCTVGLPMNIVDALQRGGRAIRTGNEPALFVVFYESWALTIEEDEFEEGTDPDRPRTKLTPKSRLQERASLSGIRLVKCRTCLRQFYAEYLDDRTDEALKYTTEFCCDLHDDGFNLQDFLPGKLFLPSNFDNEPKAPRVSSKARRAKAERIILEDIVIKWLDTQAKNDPYHRPTYEILSSEQIKILLCMLPKEITSTDAITDALDETPEWKDQWADQIFKLIIDFDKERDREQGLSAKAVRDAEKADQQAAMAALNLAATSMLQGVGATATSTQIQFVISTAADYVENSNSTSSRSTRSSKRQRKS